MNRFVRSTAIAGLLLCSTVFAGDAATTPAAKRIDRSSVVIIAHRGDSQAYPENTIPAFESAIRAKADFIELDYYHSSDGVPIIFHDKTLDRTTNAVALWNEKKIPVGSKSLQELKTLDAGSWKDPKFAGVKIPTLDEALDVIQKGSFTLVERKSGDAKSCIELLKRKKLIETVAVQAFDWDYLRDCHKLCPTLALGALGSKELTQERLDEIETTGAKFIGWHHEDLTAESIAAAKKRGLKVWVYTVNKPADAKRVLALGVDGIISDVPAAIRKYVNEHKQMPVPVPAGAASGQ